MGFTAPTESLTSDVVPQFNESTLFILCDGKASLCVMAKNFKTSNSAKNLRAENYGEDICIREW